jgi:hypothetical protein
MTAAAGSPYTPGPPPKAAVGCFLAFTVPFALFALWLGARPVRVVAAWAAAHGWAEVPAEILTARLDVFEHNEGVGYRVRATYRYRFQGTDYESDRVWFLDEADGVDDFARTTHARLRAARDAQERVPCFVNPADPRQSVLSRDLRWKVVTFLSVASLAFLCPFVVVAVVFFVWSRVAARPRWAAPPRV